MSRIRTYVVGRQQDCDLRLDDSTVSRRHAEVILTPDGRYYLTDCNSAGGTYIHEGAGWRQIRQEFVSAGARLRFGHCEITAARFEALRPRGGAISGPARGRGSTPAELTASKSEPGPDPRRGLRRDTITGEIIEQRGGEHG